MARVLESSSSDDQTKEDALLALKELYLKFKGGYGITCAMQKNGAIKPMVGLLKDGTAAQKGRATELISTLAYSSRFGLTMQSGVQAAIKSFGAIPTLVSLLREGEGRIQEHAAAALENLAMTSADRQAIAEAFGGCREMTTLVKTGSSCQKELAVRILRGLLTDGHQEAFNEAHTLLSSEAGQVGARAADGQVIGAPEVTVC